MPAVVDCDRVSVGVWDAPRRLLVHSATTSARPEGGSIGADRAWAPTPGGPLQRMLDDPHAPPMFVDAESGDPVLRALCENVGAVAALFVPLAAHEQLLGLLTVSVDDQPERLAPSRDLLDRLSGVGAQATTALQNARLLDQITYQATHDDLTGLANRLHFKQRLGDAIDRAREQGRQVTAFYLDLDWFKPVNDEFGHDVGDELLAAVARRLESCTRPDDLVARLGGDEFALLLDSASTREATERVAARLATAFDEPFTVSGRPMIVGASIGRATFPEDASTAEQLLTSADAAMFERKRTRTAAVARASVS